MSAEGPEFVEGSVVPCFLLFSVLFSVFSVSRVCDPPW